MSQVTCSHFVKRRLCLCLFLSPILFAIFVTALAVPNASLKPTKSAETSKSKCNVNNNYSQQLLHRAKRQENRATAGPGQLAEIKQELRELKRNKTGGSDGIGLYVCSL